MNPPNSWGQPYYAPSHPNPPSFPFVPGYSLSHFPINTPGMMASHATPPHASLQPQQYPSSSPSSGSSQWSPQMDRSTSFTSVSSQGSTASGFSSPYGQQQYQHQHYLSPLHPQPQQHLQYSSPSSSFSSGYSSPFAHQHHPDQPDSSTFHAHFQQDLQYPPHASCVTSPTFSPTSLRSSFPSPASGPSGGIAVESGKVLQAACGRHIGDGGPVRRTKTGKVFGICCICRSPVAKGSGYSTFCGKDCFTISHRDGTRKRRERQREEKQHQEPGMNQDPMAIGQPPLLASSSSSSSSSSSCPRRPVASDAPTPFSHLQSSPTSATLSSARSHACLSAGVSSNSITSAPTIMYDHSNGTIATQKRFGDLVHEDAGPMGGQQAQDAFGEGGDVTEAWIMEMLSHGYQGSGGALDERKE